MEAATLTMPEMARQLGISRKQVYNILNKKKYSHFFEYVVIADRKRITKESFQKFLDGQDEYHLDPANDYEELANKIDDLYRDFCTDDIHDTSKLDKLMTWYGVSKDTIFDNSTSKLADLLINGTNMGIIEGRKLLNNKNMNKTVKKITSEYVKMQEKYIEKLKKFL